MAIPCSKKDLELAKFAENCNGDAAVRTFDPCSLDKLQGVIDAINNLEISGGGVSFVKDYTVGEAASISAYRAVTIDPASLASAVYVQPDDTLLTETIGIAITAGNNGNVVQVQCDGFVTSGTFSTFDVGCPVFATADGQLVNSMPTFVDGEYIMRVGRYVGHNTIEIEIEEPELISLCP